MVSTQAVESINKAEFVRTCMRLGQPRRVTIRAVDGKPLHSLHPLQVNEPSKWYTRGSCCETQNLGPLLPVERLQCSPPPNNDRVRACVSVVLGCSSPFVHINVRCSRDKQFHLLFVELDESSEGEGIDHAEGTYD